MALKPVDIAAAAGTAVLRVSAQQRTVSLTVSNLPSATAMFYAVWLMDPSHSGLVSLGVLGVDGRGVYIVPAGLDLTAARLSMSLGSR